ncbi:Hypothetical predicted protein, partial [Paramuricea clavata]
NRIAEERQQTHYEKQGMNLSFQEGFDTQMWSKDSVESISFIYMCIGVLGL